MVYGRLGGNRVRNGTQVTPFKPVRETDRVTRLDFVYGVAMMYSVPVERPVECKAATTPAPIPPG